MGRAVLHPNERVTLFYVARDTAEELDGAVMIDNAEVERALMDARGWPTGMASASPSVVKLPLSVAEAVDPEEAFVASLASCHMLWFLDLASKSGLLVDSYEDDAEGTMGRNDKGKLAMLQIALRPFVRFLGHQPSPDVIGDIHHRAHQECFLARSVRCEVLVRPRLEVE